MSFCIWLSETVCFDTILIVCVDTLQRPQITIVVPDGPFPVCSINNINAHLAGYNHADLSYVVVR